MFSISIIQGMQIWVQNNINDALLSFVIASAVHSYNFGFTVFQVGNCSCVFWREIFAFAAPILSYNTLLDTSTD